MTKLSRIIIFIFFCLISTGVWAMPKIAIFFTERSLFSEENAENIKKVINSELTELGAGYELVPIEEVAFRFDDEYEFPESNFREKRFIIRIFARLRLDSLIVAKLVKMGENIIFKLKYIHKSEIEKLDFDKAPEYIEYTKADELQQGIFYKPMLQKILIAKRSSGIPVGSIDRSNEGVAKVKQEPVIEKETGFGKNLIALYSGKIEPKELRKPSQKSIVPVVVASTSLDEKFRADTQVPSRSIQSEKKQRSVWDRSYWPLTIVGSIVTGSISAYAAYYYINNQQEHYETVTIKGVP